MSEFPLLQRPALASVQFDYKSGKTPQGWPLEHIKTGTLSGLVAYLCFYATRLSRPELVGSDQKRLGYDPDFVRIFWTMMPTFATPKQVINEIEKLLLSGWESGQALTTIQVCEALKIGIDPTQRMFLWLSEHHKAELIYGTEMIVARIKQNAFEAVSPGTVKSDRERESPFERLRSISDGGITDAPLSSFDAEAVAELENQISIAKFAMDIASGSGKAAPATTTTILAIIADVLHPSMRPSTPTAAATAEGKLGFLTSMVSARSFESAAGPTLSNLLGTKVDVKTRYTNIWGATYPAIAAQWTYIEHHLFRAIPVVEWLGCGWDKPRYEHAADAIRRYIDHFNATSLWVTAEVLSQDTPAERAAMIVRFIKVGVLLRRYNNFSGLVELSLGLKRQPVARLHTTWALVPRSAMERLAAIYAITDDKKNYRAYKEALHLLPSSAPIVPHLGAHTSELTMQDQLLPTEMTSSAGQQMLHFRRFRELYKITMPIVDMQDNGYEGTELPPANPSLINILSSTVVAFMFPWDEDREAAVAQLERRSHIIEPPERLPTEEGTSFEEGGSVDDGTHADGKSAAWLQKARSFFSPSKPSERTTADGDFLGDS